MKKKNKFIINGGRELKGEIRNQTSKNATLPIFSACLLADGVFKIKECPDITDIDNMKKLLIKLGARVRREDDNYYIDTKHIKSYGLDCKLSKTMRSSLFLLGSTLSRFGQIVLTTPGGCKIGKRPIDLHITSLKKLGVKVAKLGDYVLFDATNKHSGVVKLKIPSVGATENLIQFAAKLKGKTIIYNPAREPEVVDLANFLNLMGAKIIGAGTKKITIYGVDKLHPAEYRPMGDRIVAGTIMSAVAIAGGDVTISNACTMENKKIIEILRSMGCQIDVKNDIIHIIKTKSLKSAQTITTGYYPEFPTDLQSIVLATSCFANGETVIKEKIFENRFLIVDELKKMGANIQVLDNSMVKISESQNIYGTTVKAEDLRGGVALVLAGLGANGQTIVENIDYIDRGYDHIENILTYLGADIRRV